MLAMMLSQQAVSNRFSRALRTDRHPPRHPGARPVPPRGHGGALVPGGTRVRQLAADNHIGKTTRHDRLHEATGPYR